jgi:hypothetical protein
MALHSLGTNSTSSLQAIQWFPSQVPSPAGTNQISYQDIAAISESISGPGLIAAVAGGNPPNSAASGILFTASTHSNTTLDTFAANTGGALSTIQVGALVLGVGIPAGNFVAARTPATGTPTSITLSQAATASAAGVRIVVSPLAPRSALDPGFQSLHLPQGRGVIKLFPGDYIAISNTGWPIIIPANEIAYAGSLWTFT